MENKIQAILAGLNEEQGNAVRATDGPVLIVAGAGSGKTRVLTSRVAYLLANGVEPSGILALTFTKKAAAEMKERIAVMVGPGEARRVVMGTFHSVFIRFLRDYAEFLGYPAAFTIYDSSDQLSAVKACIKELGLSDKEYAPRRILSRISSAKNSLHTCSGYASNEEALAQDRASRIPRFSEVYTLYQKKLKASGAMDFDDILLNMNILLRDNREALEEISSRFSHIMVDEYQDTNVAQYKIILKLARRSGNICVVGDDSQSIYGFRGAQIQNILNFQRDFPNARTFRLELNYRSTANIVNAANSLIAHNSGRIPKECRSATGNKGELIKLLSCNDERDEAMSIVSEILSCIRKTSASYEDFAVLYRTNAQSRAIEEQLRRRNIPYLIYSGNSFFERAEVKDLMAYFKLAVNPLDDESFKRIVNKPARGIGDTTLAGLATAAQVRQTTLFRAVYLDDIESFGVKPAAVAKLKSFCSMIDSFHTLVPQTDAYELATKIADESGLYASFKADNSIEGQSRVSNIEELVNSVMLFVNEQREQAEDEEALFTLDIFLEDVSLLSNVDTSDPDESGNKVALMTVHTAKGLEFPYVFIAGMEEHLFPSYSEEMAISPEDLEEERRLFYVALTRAEREVWIAFADSRMRSGRTSSNPPSRFVREIDSRYIANPLDEDQFSPASWGGFGSRGFRSEAGSGRNAYLRNSASGGTAFSGRSAAADRSSSSDRIAAFPSRSSDSAVQRKPSTAAAKAARYADFVPVPMTELYVGERIEHNTFGAGIILEITGTVPELRAKVRFDELGEKLLLLKYAKLRPEQK